MKKQSDRVYKQHASNKRFKLTKKVKLTVSALYFLTNLEQEGKIEKAVINAVNTIKNQDSVLSTAILQIKHTINVNEYTDTGSQNQTPDMVRYFFASDFISEY